MTHENEKQYYRVNEFGWYIHRKNDVQYEDLFAYKNEQTISNKRGEALNFVYDHGCKFEPITEESYNRLRKWVLAKILK